MYFQSYIQELTKDQMQIIEELKELGQIYIVSPKCLDDYYWMISSVSSQTRSNENKELETVSPNDDKKWPGARPILITNDQMRDHKLELLEPRLFRRWCSSHIVNYSFPPYAKDEAEEREIDFKPADFFSYEIQGNQSNDNIVWHIPISEWGEKDRFCVKVPKLIQSASSLGEEWTSM